MIIHYNCTIGSFLLHSFLLIYHHYPPSFHDALPPCLCTWSRECSDTPVLATFKLIFTPFYKYGACETAQEGGYINTGTFNDQIDTSKPLFLCAHRGENREQFFIHYLGIELF